jgi:hypothetical protein
MSNKDGDKNNNNDKNQFYRLYVKIQFNSLSIYMLSSTANSKLQSQL